MDINSEIHSMITSKHDGKWDNIKNIWYKIDDWLEEYVPLYGSIKNLKYYVISRIRQTHMIDTGLEKGHWIDKVELIKSGLLQIVEDYVSRDKEDAFCRVCYDFDEYHQDIKLKIIEVLYFKNIWFPENKEKYEKMLDDNFEEFPIIWGKLDDNIGRITFKDENNPKREQQRNEYIELEKKIEEETQRILHLIVDIRYSLWT